MVRPTRLTFFTPEMTAPKIRFSTRRSGFRNWAKSTAFESKAAVAAAAGSPYSSLVMQHADDFATFQRLLDTRCPGGGCEPIVSAASLIEGGKKPNAANEAAAADAANEGKGKERLAALNGPLATASSYSEDLFLEFAQCRPEGQMTSLNSARFRAAFEAGMRLHVLAYDVNARNAYNPFVRGGTLLAHIAAMLGQKAGRTGIFRRIATPVLEGKTLAIFSGHDTQLGALGGILNAHWNPEDGIVPDDMPPGSALVFDLVRAPDGEYGVRLRFASMTLNQFRTEKPIEGGIKVSPVAYTGCSGDGCVMPLAQFEVSRAHARSAGLCPRPVGCVSVEVGEGSGVLDRAQRSELD